ncbi:unnamed protein product [Arctogadus glacialis]
MERGRVRSGYRRMTRSNSVTRGRAGGHGRAAPPPSMPTPRCSTMPRGWSRDATSTTSSTSTVSIQGSGNHYHACSGDDYSDPGFDPLNPAASRPLDGRRIRGGRSLSWGARGGLCVHGTGSGS